LGKRGLTTITWALASVAFVPDFCGADDEFERIRVLVLLH
jgi:hypothetical protein